MSARETRLKTGFEDYTENEYGKTARITDPIYRERLASWQVPAIKTHFGNLTGKVFLDVGAGDLVLGDRFKEIGEPHIFYAQDLSLPSLESGLLRITGSKADAPPFVTMASDNFDFSRIPNGTVDCAFSNSLFSHLSINSILLCLRQLAPKMRTEGKYLSSMIIVSSEEELLPFDWSVLGIEGSSVVSHFGRDPFHYSEHTLRSVISTCTPFDLGPIHDYGHPFQKLVEFTPSQ